MSSYRQPLLWAVIALALIATVYLALTYWRKGTSQQNGGATSCEITFFYSPGCGHCTAFKPTWESVVAADQGRSGCTFKAVDATQQEALATSEEVSAFPTVVKKSAGRRGTLVGNQDASALRQFIEGKL